MIPGFQRQAGGFSSVELLLALAIGAAVIGAAAIAYGSIARSQPRVGSMVSVGLDSNKISNFYNVNQSSWNTSVAPSYGALARAEDMREQFLADTLSATAVYCLSRPTINSYRPYTITYNPATDLVLDTNLNFRQHLINKGLTTGAVFNSAARNYDSTVTNATIFVMGYSGVSTALTVSAIYEIDILRATSPATGYYASVRRYVATATSPAALTQYYDVYYPPPPTPPAGFLPDTENFAPIWVSFERYSRRDKPETADIERFKAAKEKPFHFIWWPDPAARTLGLQWASSTSNYGTTDARRAYNHMCGRTSFMFTVPMFPSL